MSRLNIIRASAGSGKTNRLADFFLEILLKENLDYFKNILGVTFTNKAMEEMKRRIIEKLYRFSDSGRQDYPEAVLRYFKGDKTRIKEKSHVLLKNILHQYSWFSIETIDTFFQRVIRAFTRELGIPGNYTIEIDTLPVLKYAIDQLLDGLEDKMDLLSWLMQFSENKISEGKSWDINNDLLGLGNEIFREEFAAGAGKLQLALSEKEKLYAFRDRLFGITKYVEKRCSECGKEALEQIRVNGLEAADFFQKRNGAVSFFSRLEQGILRDSKGELITRSALINKLLDDARNWPSSDTKRKTEVCELASNILLPLLSKITGFIEKEYINYFTAGVILKNLYTVGILVDIEEKIRQYRLEKNVFILSDAPKLLDRIINHNDTPFIYEKMGNRYSHFLIDEFQDTSKLQWSNFKPLISNSLSQAKDCLIVGDVKQSIYRWRNGDWNILARNISDEYIREIIQYDSLDINWRSAENIVNFNNILFQQAQKKIAGQLQLIFGENHAITDTHLEVLKSIYSGISQTVPDRHKNKGKIVLRFFSKKTAKEQPDYFAGPLIDTVNLLLEKDYSPEDIALLVRNKKEGKLLADLIIKANTESKFFKPVEVISDESLFLLASNAVNMMIAAMQCLNSPDENLYWAKLTALYKVHQESDITTSEVTEMKLDAGFFEKQRALEDLPSGFTDHSNELASLPLYELAEQLTGIFQAYKHKADIPYIHAFLDLIYEYSQANPPDIKAFLEYWTDEGQIKSIPATESGNAIRILTIHKAKGLEFPVVLVPFCSWGLNQMTNSVFWVKAPEAPFDFLPLVPLNFNKGLKDTRFAGEYFNELFKSFIDNLNLLYVAFTRASDTLIAFPVFSDPEKNMPQISTVGDLVFECIAGNDGQEFTENFDSSRMVYEIGSFKTGSGQSKKIPAGNLIIQSYSGQPATSRMYFNAYGYEYFRDITQIRDRRIRGKVLHDLLAKIVTLDDLESTLRESVFEGLISEDEGRTLSAHIRSVMDNPTVRTWYDGKGEILTEWEIVLPGENTKRPDRVVVWPGEVHVIDYKFSIEPRDNLYNRQVKDYMNIISEVEHKPVRGFLWYVDKNEVVEIMEK